MRLQKVDIQVVAVNFEATACHTGHKLKNTLNEKKQDVMLKTSLQRWVRVIDR